MRDHMGFIFHLHMNLCTYWIFRTSVYCTCWNIQWIGDYKTLMGNVIRSLGNQLPHKKKYKLTSYVPVVPPGQPAQGVRMEGKVSFYHDKLIFRNMNQL